MRSAPVEYAAEYSIHAFFDVFLAIIALFNIIPQNPKKGNRKSKLQTIISWSFYKGHFRNRCREAH